MIASHLDDQGARFDVEHSDLHQAAPQRGVTLQDDTGARALVRPSPRLEQQKALDLGGMARLWKALAGKAKGKVAVAPESWPAFDTQHR